MSKSRILLISMAAGAAAALVPWLVPKGVLLWELLLPEAKLAILVALATALLIAIRYSLQLLHRQLQRKPARGLLQGFGTCGDNIMRREKALFPERGLNREVAKYLLGISGMPVEEGELSDAGSSRTWVQWSGFPCHVVELAAGQDSVSGAEAARKTELDDYCGLAQKVLISANPVLNITLIGNGVTGLSSAACFPWAEVSRARTHLLWVVSDQEEDPSILGKESNCLQQASEVLEDTTEAPQEEDIGKPMVTIRGRVLTRATQEKVLSLPEEKLKYMERVSHQVSMHNCVVVLSQNLPERGLDNKMRRRALLTIALTAAEEKHGGLFSPDETVSSIGAGDDYWLSRYPGVYTHSELRRITGLNGVMALIQDLRTGNLVWHLQSFRRGPFWWQKRKVLIAFAVGNPRLLESIVQALNEAVPATPVCITHNVAGIDSAYVLLLAPVCEREVLDSPFKSFRWGGLETALRRVTA